MGAALGRRGVCDLVAASLALCAWLLVLVLPGPARANDFDEFQQARAAYERGAYGTARELFLELVGDEPPRLSNQSLILESLKYLAASELFKGDAEEAARQFRRLLSRESDYVLDPLAFPEEVQRVFARVKAELKVEAQTRIDAEAKAEAEAAARKRARDAAEEERLQRLLDLAKIERVEVRNSRWIALLPFGAGQFQNGDRGLGVLLAVSQVLLAGASVTTYALHEGLRDERPIPEQRSDAQFAERAYRYTNQASIVALVAVAVAGIIDAQIRFHEAHVTERKRSLPPELLAKPKLSFTGDGFRLQF